MRPSHRPIRPPVERPRPAPSPALPARHPRWGEPPGWPRPSRPLRAFIFHGLVALALGCGDGSSGARPLTSAGAGEPAVNPNPAPPVGPSIDDPDPVVVELPPASDPARGLEPPEAEAEPPREPQVCGGARVIQPVHGDGTLWIASGDLADASLADLCGATAPTVAIPIDAPVDGAYTALVTGDEPLTISTTRACDEAGAWSLECGSPVDGENTAAMTVEARAGERIWFFARVADGAPGPFALSVHRSAALASPTIDALRAVRVGGSARVQAVIRDANADVERVTLWWVDATGRARLPAVNLTPSVAPLGRPVMPVDVSVDEVPDFARAARLVATDTTSRTMTRTVPLTTPPLAANGAACDPEGLESRCAEGSHCVALGAESVCLDRARPEVLTADVTWRDGWLAVRARVSAPRAGAYQLVSTPLDGEGRVIGWSRAADFEGDDTLAPVVVELRPRSLHTFWAPTAVELLVLGDDVALDPVIVPVRIPADSVIGERCDPARIADRCGDGLICVDGEVPTCRPSRPVLNAAQSRVAVNRVGASARLWLVGMQGAANPLRRVTLRFEADGEALGGWEPGWVDEPECNDDNPLCVWRLGAGVPLAIRDMPEAAVRVHVRLPGAETIVIDESPRAHQLPVGAPCGEDDFAYCPWGTLCRPSNHDGPAVCDPADVPVIEAGQAWLHPDTRALGLRLEGTVVEGWPEGVYVRAFDFEGLEIPIAGALTRLSLDSLELDGEAFIVTVEVPFDWLPVDRHPALTPASIEVHISDRTRARSAPLRVPVEATPIAEVGAPCTELQATLRCPEGAVCSGAFDPAPPSTCVFPAVECPDDWGAASLNDAWDGERWTIRGDTREREHRARPVQFGGRGPEQIYAFTPPRDGRYRLEAVGQDAPIDLYVRAMCGHGASQIGPAGRERERLIELEGGETVYIFADSHIEALGTPFTLTVEQHAAPTIERARARRSTTTNMMHIDLWTHPDEPDARSVSLYEVDDPNAVGWGETAFVGVEGGLLRWQARIFVSETPLAHVGVSFSNEDRYHSEVKVVEIEAPEVVAKGDACDPHGAANVCEAPFACPEHASGLEARCQRLPGHCPDAWPVQDLSAAPHGPDTWFIFGQLRTDDAVRGLAQTWSYNATVADLHHFEADRAGVYRFEVEGSRALIFARSTCTALSALGLDDPANADRRLTPGRELTLELQAGQAITLFVGRLHLPSGSLYALRATRL